MKVSSYQKLGFSPDQAVVAAKAAVHNCHMEKVRVAWSNCKPAPCLSLTRSARHFLGIALLYSFSAVCLATDLPIPEVAMTKESVITFLNRFEEIAGSKKFDLIDDLIHDDAVFRFNDGDFAGKQAIRGAFEKTWEGSAKVEGERFYLTDIQVLMTDAKSAAATYTYNWEGSVAGQSFQIRGRGTRVLVVEDGKLQIILEHLSANPKQ